MASSRIESWTPRKALAFEGADLIHFAGDVAEAITAVQPGFF